MNCKAHAISGFCENLEILPMGNVRHFRRIRKNDILLFENERFSLIFSEFVYFSVEIPEKVCFSSICLKIVRF